jgi:hypothetical protein
MPEGLEPMRGEDKGDGPPDAPAARGSSSSFRRPICGVGGVEPVATFDELSVPAFTQSAHES